MPKATRILVVVDPSKPQQPALERAIEIAAAMQATVECFTCFHDPRSDALRRLGFADDNKNETATVADGLKKLKEKCAPFADKGVRISVHAAWDSPRHEAIVRAALRSDATLIIKETRHHSLAERTLFSHADWQLIRECPCPLWLVKTASAFQKPVIVAAVDPLHAHDKPAALDQALMHHATEIAEKTSGSVHILYAADLLPQMPIVADDLSPPGKSAAGLDISNELHDKYMPALQRLAEKFGVSGTSLHVLQGSAENAIPEFAASHAANLVVMGAVSRSVPQRLLLGSTAEHVLDRIPCDVLIVKPERFMSPITFKSQLPGAVHVVEDLAKASI